MTRTSPTRLVSQRVGRFGWKSWATLIVLIFVIVPTGVIRHSLNLRAREVAAELALIRSAGEPTNADELEKVYQTPNLDLDCSAIYLRVFGLLEDGEFRSALSPTWPLSIDSDVKVIAIPAPGQPWADLGAIQKLVADNNDSLKLLHEAVALGGQARYSPSQRFGYRRAGLYLATRLLFLEALVKTHEGDTPGGARSLRAMIALVRSLDHEHLHFPQQYRTLDLDYLCDCITRLLSIVEFAEDDLKRLQRDLRSIPHREPFRRFLLSARVWGIMAHENPAMVNVKPLPWDNASLVWYLRIMRRVIEATEKPWPEVFVAAKAAEQELCAASEAREISQLHQALFREVGLPASTWRLCMRLRVVAKIRATDAVIAAELYRREHGDWPNELAELVPKFLPEVPEDPFDGQPIRWLRTNEKLMIYSVDEDLVDDEAKINGYWWPSAAVRVYRRKRGIERDAEGKGAKSSNM